MVKKRSWSSSQPNLFQEEPTPSSSTTEEITPTPPPPPPPVKIVCPKCGGAAAKSVKGGEFIGLYYCQGPCSCGDNFYFTPSGDSTTSAPNSD